MKPPKKLIDYIKSHDKFFVTAHINLEPDALGSAIAASYFLKGLGKKSVVKMPEESPKRYSFLEKHISKKPDFPIEQTEVFFVVDCPNLDRTGCLKEKILNSKAKIINIDHHVSNVEFGDINWVDPHASSAGEMIYRLFDFLKMPVNKAVAECIYSAILTDTGFFRYDNTSAESFMIMSKLISKVQHRIVAERLFGHYSLDRMKLLGEVLCGLDISKDGSIGCIDIKQDMFKNKNVDMSDTEGFIDFVRTIEGIKVAICFKEQTNPEMTKVSFRSACVNVDKVARCFKGGGHKAASGCEIYQPLEQAKKIILGRVRKEINHG